MDLNYFWRKKVVLSYVLAVLVFIIHISALCNYTTDLADDSFMQPWRWFVLAICRCAVPAFFILSGAVFFRDYDNSKYISKLKSRVTSLLLPYLTWNTIWMVFGVLTTLYLSQYFLGRAASDISPIGIVLSVVHWSDNAPFWFVFNLITFIIASPLIYALLKIRYIGVISILAVIIATQMGYGIYQPVFYMPDSIVYYLAGAYIGLHHFEWFATRSKYKTICGILIVAFCITLRSLYPVETENLFIWNRSGFHGAILLIIYGIAVTFMFDIFNYPQQLPNFCSHSFWVYAMHLNLSAVICKLLYFVLPKSVYGAWSNFVLTIILTLVIIECVATITNKYCKPLYRILSGDRK